MFSLSASVVPSSTSQLARSEVPKVGQIKSTGLCSLPLRPLSTQPATFGGQVQVSKMKSAAFICAAALNARMGAEQTQTVTRQSSTITIAPVQGKEKSPDLDDGGPGLPLSTQPATFGGQVQVSKMKSAAFICAAALESNNILYKTIYEIPAFYSM
ncbi:uncharacterized protein LOC143589424 [Bidens hawaiensis]|uniref:uncharacterized protein LOC143589424 n=1 Tax=Bidens hawaiensis TaxID=980011 RepID=UPI0040492E7A